MRERIVCKYVVCKYERAENLTDRIVFEIGDQSMREGKLFDGEENERGDSIRERRV